MNQYVVVNSVKEPHLVKRLDQGLCSDLVKFSKADFAFNHEFVFN